jgi:hypothetical protein
MSKESIPLRQIAYARSGDKGNNSNIGVIAYTHEGYDYLVNYLTPKRVEEFFKSLGIKSIKRYELPNLWALNFVLFGALGGGGSRSLRIDSQGKALGQAILEMNIQVPTEKLAAISQKNHTGGLHGSITHS